MTTPARPRLADRFEQGLNAPICLTWELTYACNLACIHCLSSSGRRDPAELTTAECRAVIDELESMQVFYVNIGGGEPTVRPDFFELVEYATSHHVGVKFSTNGSRISGAVAERLTASDYVDVQISLDGATAAVNDAVRGPGSFATALAAMSRLAEAGFEGFKLSVVVTRHNVGQLDELKALADRHSAQLRLTRLRPSGRGAAVWHDLHPSAEDQRELHAWLVAHGEDVLTGDSFFHLAPYGEPLPGLNLCGAGRVVCLIDPVGDVYACPFTIHEEFLAGNVRGPAGSPTCGATPISSPSCAARRAGVPARAAGTTTRAAAGAWRPSSSPGSRSTARIPSARSGTVPPRSPRVPNPSLRSPRPITRSSAALGSSTRKARPAGTGGRSGRSGWRRRPAARPGPATRAPSLR